MKYLDTSQLPFNFSSLDGQFQWLRPGDTQPEKEKIWIFLKGGDLIVATHGDLPCFWRGDIPPGIVLQESPVCFGLWNGLPVMAARVSQSSALLCGLRTEPFNAIEDTLDDRMLTLGGLARQVLAWRKESRLCSICGAETEAVTGSWGRRCTGCKREKYPPVHPCVIVLVRRGKEFLLTRKAEWTPGRYSLVAGFVDQGESLEECAAREVLEETGISIRDLWYVGSQHWPFPSQLMAGFIAEYAGGEIVVERDELEDARWFSPDDLPPGFPGRRSIARWIIDRFALGKQCN